MGDPMPHAAPVPTDPVLEQLQRLRREFAGRIEHEETSNQVSKTRPLAAALNESLGRHALVSALTIVLLVGGLGVWANATDVAGAVVISGVLTTDTGVQKVQHDEGGVVSAILGRDGDRVVAGQVLLRLDGTSARAALDLIDGQLRDSYARLARLTAEAAQSGELVSSPDAKEFLRDPNYASQLTAEQKLLATRAEANAQQVAQLREQIEQLRHQIGGLSSQLTANTDALSISRKEEADVTGLFATGLADATRLNDVRRSRAALEAEVGRLTGAKAEAESQIAERLVQVDSVEVQFRSSVMSDLETTRSKINELLQQRISARERLDRLDVRAPQSGIISQSVIQTVGGIAPAGETLMLVVPEQTEILVDARLSPSDVGNVAQDQSVSLRFPSLDQRITPAIDGVVQFVSPDLIRDPQTGQTYYSVRIAAGPDAKSKLPTDFKITPGTPVVVFARTGDRSVLTYLLQPIAEQMVKVFIEK